MVSPPPDIFDHEPYDSLALRDIKRLSRTAQAGEERRESLRQSQEGCPIVGLVSDRLQLSTKRLFTLAQRRHALAQTARSTRVLPGSIEKSFHAFANMRQLPLQTLLTFLGRIARARAASRRPVLLNQVGSSSSRSPPPKRSDRGDPVDKAAVVANRPPSFASYRADTFVVVDLARLVRVDTAREA